MKNKFKLLIIFAVFVSLIFSCNDPFAPEELDKNGMGYFVLRFTDNEERTIMPNFNSSLDDSIVGYTFKLTHTTTSAVTSIYRTKVEFDEAEGMIRVSPGSYHLHVTAYSEYEDQDNNIPIGTADYASTLNVPTASTIWIYLKPIKTEGEGKFSWDVRFLNSSWNEYNLNQATMEIIGLTSGATIVEDPINLLGSESPNTKVDNITLNSGQYRVIFSLVKDNNTKPVTWRETLHIYAGVESKFDRNFQEALFIRNSYAITFMYDNETIYIKEGVYQGERAIRPTAPVNELSLFIDWYTEDDVLWNFTTILTDDLVLYAKWFTPDYSISGGDGVFTAASSTFTSSPGSIQSAVDAIRANAGGSAITIWFHGGLNQFNNILPLNIGTDSITFSGSWGLVTLIGEIRSDIEAGSTITVEGSVSIESQATISNTASTTAGAKAITNSGSGTVTINGGTVRASGAGFSIDNTANGTIIVKSGSVTTTASNGIAIVNRAAGIVNVTGGTVSATTPEYSFAGGGNNHISIAIANKAGGAVNVSGGTVSAIVPAGEFGTPPSRANQAISNESSGTITVTGGTISSISSGTAISLETGSTGAVNISGGAVRSASGSTIWNGGTGKITISGNASITMTGPGSAALSISNTSAITEIIGGSINHNNNNSGGSAITNSGIMTIANASVNSWTDPALSNSGTVTIYDGGNLSSGNTLSTNRLALSNTGTITMEGGEIRSNSGIVAQNSGSGKIIMNGGLIYGGGRGVRTTGMGAGEIILNAGEISSPEDAIRIEGSDTVTINGGKLTTSYGFAINNYGQGNVVLNNTPEITGRIRTADGKLRTLSTFAPGSNQYVLDFASYAASIIAVVDGASFLSRFTLNNQDDWELGTSGANLVIRAK